MDEIKCPECGSNNVVCMDGLGAVARYGKSVMIDVAPDIWLCNDCKETFRADEADIQYTSVNEEEAADV